MVLTRALGERWDDVNAAHVALIRRGRRRPSAGPSSGPRATPCSPHSGRPAPRSPPRSPPSARSQAHAWPEDATIRVRMGVHSGEAHRAGDDYGGFEVSRAARVAAVGHGGQIVLSGADLRRSIADDLPAGTTARDLGLFVLKDVPATRAAVPARRPGPAGRVPAAPRRPDDGRQSRADG